MKKLSSITLLFLFMAAFNFIPKLVLADGMLMEPDPYSDRWDYSNESNQQAFIDYENGLQKMIISIGFENKNNNGAVWLFPVPADPNKVVVDVVKNLPQLSGEEISKKAKHNLDGMTTALWLTQFYTFPLVAISGSIGATNSGSFGATDSLGNSVKGVEPDVIVYEHLDKEGIASEIITAKTAYGLIDYLKSKGLKIENGSIPVLDNYIGKEYSFVVSWISSPENLISAQEIKNQMYIYFGKQGEYPNFYKFITNLKQKYPELDQADKNSHIIEFLQSPEGGAILQEMVQAIQNDPSIIEDSYNRIQNNPAKQKGVFVTFPTKDIYFPLLPTSVYGSKTVPATIRIFGHVSPRVFPDIRSYTTTDYYIDESVSFADDLKSFYNGKNKSIKYTKIEINAPSKFFTNDLWISQSVPVKTYYSDLVAEHPGIVWIILIILSSILVGVLVGLIFFKDLRKNLLKIGLIGLSNCLTLLGLIITTVLVGTKNKNESLEPLLDEIKQNGYFWKRKVAMILFCISIPVLSISMLAVPPMMMDFIYTLIHYGINGFMRDFSISFFIIFYVLPIAALIFGFVVKKIKMEDRNLFTQLKQAGYSSWSFQPKDEKKVGFVFAFTFTFLLISWLLVKLIEITV